MRDKLNFSVSLIVFFKLADVQANHRLDHYRYNFLYPGRWLMPAKITPLKTALHPPY
jgi:hypothetical protein